MLTETMEKSDEGQPQKQKADPLRVLWKGGGRGCRPVMWLWDWQEV